MPNKKTLPQGAVRVNSARTMQLLIFISFLCSMVSGLAQASGPVFSRYIWPAEEYRALRELNQGPNYCELAIATQNPALPNAAQMDIIASAIARGEGLLSAFRTRYFEGTQGISIDLAGEFDRSIKEFIDLENTYGFKFGVKAGFVVLKETMSVFLALEGFVPTQDELTRLEAIVRAQIEEAGGHDRLATTSQSQAIRWNLAMLQKMEGVFESVYFRELGSLNLSQPLIQAYFRR